MSYLVLSWALPNGVSVKEMELAICRSISFIYPSFASLNCLVCQPPILGLTSTARHHPPAVIHPKVFTIYPVIPYKVFSSWNSKIVRIISAKESGDYSLKKLKMKNPTLPKSCKQGVQIKTKFPFQVWVHHLHPFDIPQIWLIIKSFTDHYSAQQYR